MYKTPDIALAIALITSDVKLRQLDKLKQNKYLFCFEEGTDTARVIESFWKQEVLLSIQETMSWSRKLKAMIKHEQNKD